MSWRALHESCCRFRVQLGSVTILLYFLEAEARAIDSPLSVAKGWAYQIAIKGGQNPTELALLLYYWLTPLRLKIVERWKVKLTCSDLNLIISHLELAGIDGSPDVSSSTVAATRLSCELWHCFARWNEASLLGASDERLHQGFQWCKHRRPWWARS